MSAAIPMPLTTAEVGQALDIARAMARAGIPLFVAPPCAGAACTPECRARTGGTGTAVGYHLPGSWETTTADPGAVDHWQPGWALCALGGLACDVLDVDPRNGGMASAEELRAAGQWPRCYSRAATPSGGIHEMIQPLGVGKGTPAPGVDLQGGRADGTGRGFVFIAPTVRASKVDGVRRPYRWLAGPDLTALARDRGETSGAALAALLPARASRGPQREGDRQPWDWLLEPTMSRRGADELIASRVATVTGHIQEHATASSWGGFRNVLNAAAYTLGGLTGSGYLTDGQASGLLEDAIRAAGYEVNGESGNTISVGLADGAREPLWVVADPPPVTSPPRHAGTAGPGPGGSRIPAEFWGARQIHHQIRDTAHSRACPADAVLGVLLARLSSMVHGGVRVDTGVGTPAALNLFAVLLGQPGDGKSTSAALARDILPIQYDYDSAEHPLGSGQGIADAFGAVDPDDGHWKQCRDKAFFTADEGALVLATARHKDSTLLATLRQAWTGGPFGARNATAERNRHVHSYSLGMWLGMQHAHAIELFSDTNLRDGTLQRFLWFSTELDPCVPSVRPPSATLCQLPLDLGVVWAQDPIRLPEHLRDEIYRRNVLHRKRLATRAPGQEHTDLYQVKVACLLAILDGRRDVVDEDWELAGLIMATSAAVAGSVQETAHAVAAQTEAQAVARRYRLAESDEARAEARTEARIAGMVPRVAAKVAENPGIRQGLVLDSYRDRDAGRVAIARAIEAGLIRAEEATTGNHGYWLYPVTQ